jgi:1-acyl-sn-glycerol-3-phosphate acyltransferase
VKYIDYSLRWLGTAVSFALFGLGGAIQGLIVYPLIRTVIRDRERSRRICRRWVGFSMHLFVRTMRTLGVLDYEIVGRARALEGQNYLILANHPSLIDVVFLLSIFPDADCVVKDSIAQNPFFYHLIRAAGYISNSDSVVMLDHAVTRINQGESLVIFPEGTRTQSGKIPNFNLGASAIAVRADCDVLPVFISCEPTTLTRQDRWYQIPDAKVKFRLAIQPPVDIVTWSGDNCSLRAATRQVNARLESYFLEGLTQAGFPGSDVSQI